MRKLTMKGNIRSIYLYCADYDIVVKGWRKKVGEIKANLEEDLKRFIDRNQKQDIVSNKLYYLDVFREKLNRKSYNYIKKEYVIRAYNDEEVNDTLRSCLIVDFDDDFARWVYDQDNNPFCCYDQEPEFYELILFIIGLVVNWKPQKESEE